MTERTPLRWAIICALLACGDSGSGDGGAGGAGSTTAVGTAGSGAGDAAGASGGAGMSSIGTSGAPAGGSSGGGASGAAGGSQAALDAGADAGGVADAAHTDAPVEDAGTADASVATDAGSVSSTYDGFNCQGVVCTAGETCVNCDFFGDAFPLICAPDPRIDSAAYDAAVAEAGCLAVYPIYECDGPEDCHAGERCVYDDDADYPGGACAPDTQPCAMPTECIICHDDADCPAPTTCGEEPVFRWAGQRRVCS